VDKNNIENILIKYFKEVSRMNSENLSFNPKFSIMGEARALNGFNYYNVGGNGKSKIIGIEDLLEHYLVKGNSGLESRTIGFHVDDYQGNLIQLFYCNEVVEWKEEV
jgi:hypothetical protein